MKKKQFEKIAPEYEGQLVKGKKKCAIGAFMQNNILSVDFYEENNGVWRALWRTLLSEKEYCNLEFDTGIWDRKQLHDVKCEYVHPYTTFREGKCQILGNAKEIINTFTELAGGCKYSDVYTTITSMESNISSEQRQTAAERKHERIQRKMASAPEVPEDFQEFIKEKLYKHCHIMYVTKESAICSRCGEVTERLNTMKHNTEGKCPYCDREIVYKHTGRMSTHDERKEVLLIQKQDEEIILRYFRCSLFSEAGKRENLKYSESVRTYHDKNIEWYKKRYIQYTDCLGRNYWEDKINAFHQVGYGSSCCLYDGNLDDIREVLGERGHLPIVEMAAEGIVLPWKKILSGQPMKNCNFERLYKAGLKKLAVEYIRSNSSIDTDYRQAELKKFLLITKPMLRYMQNHDSNKKILAVFQDAKKNNYGLNDTEIFELAEAGIKPSELKEVSQGSRIIKALHYLKRVRGYLNLRTTYQHYADYISMARNMGYDLENGTVRYPKDLKAAHDKAVTEFYEDEKDKKNREALKKYPLIKRQAAELDEKYGYRDKDYIIIAPKNAADIVEEGRKLHHCVGGDNYLNKHNSGTTFILFLRRSKEPDKRYYTIELDPKNNKILQYYGYNDKKPDKEQVDKVLDKWKKQIERKEERTKLKLAQ